MKLIEHKICRILGEELLKPTSRFELTAFLKAWQQCVPEGITKAVFNRLATHVASVFVMRFFHFVRGNFLGNLQKNLALLRKF